MSRIRFRRRLGTAVIVRAFGAAPWLAVVISGLSLAPCAAAAQAPVSTLTASSRELVAMPATDLMRLLDDTRPRPISQERRAQVLGSLPTEGEVTGLDSGHREKLVALLPVLRTAGRDNVYAIKVVAVRQAFVGLHARAVLLVSDRALPLLDTAELQALAAHEIGHEYVWDAHERAAQRRDVRRLRDLELVCDIVATVTLRSLGMDATALISGLEKLSAFNRRELGAASNESSYPTLDVRRAAVIDLARRLGASSATSAGDVRHRVIVVGPGGEPTSYLARAARRSHRSGSLGSTAGAVARPGQVTMAPTADSPLREARARIAAH